MKMEPVTLNAQVR